MLCPVCRGGAVYLNFPGVGTLRGLDTDHWALDRLQTLRVVTGQDLVRTPPIVAGEWWRWPQGEGRQGIIITITIVSRLKWSIFAALCLQ